MKVISILNQKGGSGKTTVCMHLGAKLNELGYNVLLVDSDKQGSLRDWHATNEDNILSCVGIDRPTLDKSLKSIEGYDFIVIDGVPNAGDMAVNAITVSDLVLIPIQPSPLDLWATSDLVNLVKQRIEITGGALKAAFVINRAVKNTALGEDMSDIVSQYEIPVLETVVYQRIIYPKSAITGHTVFDSKEKNKSAIKEMNDLTTEILEFLENEND